MAASTSSAPTTTSSSPHARTHKRRRLTPQQIREVAAKAYCHAGTVTRYLDGKKQWSTSSARIRDVLVAMGLEKPEAPKPTP